ncbi:MAG: 50S ribosomal protein L6 [Patescibacteria group bacterium]
MSKIGKKPVEIPDGVTVEVKDGKIQVAGAKGSLSLTLPPEIKVKVSPREIQFSQKTTSEKTKAYQGTIRNLVFNMIKGVKDGWSKTLEIIGTGYRVALLEGKLSLSLGFSHQIQVVPPPGISFTVSQNKITVSGADKMLVGQVAARIRAIKPPDAYKGKGIRFEQEQIKLKPGKQVKVGIAGAPAGMAKGGTK